MPGRSSIFQCPRNKTTFCISAQGCRDGKEVLNLKLCPLEAAEDQHNRPATKPLQYITKAEWVKIRRSNKEWRSEQ